MKQIKLSTADIGALHEIRARIELHCPQFYSTTQLLKLVYPRLNAFKLHYGFKKLFGVNVHAYYQDLRFEQAKHYLQAGEKVTAVAYILNFQSATTFIKAFRARFGMTPKQFKLQHANNNTYQ